MNQHQSATTLSERFAASLRWPVRVAVTAAVIASLMGACSSDNEPPRFTTGVSSGSGGSGGAGGSGGLGGLGGAGGVPQGPNVCACMVQALEDTSTADPCLSCHAKTLTLGGPCSATQDACQANAACMDVVDCVGTCDVGGEVDVACLYACMLPFDGDVGKQTYNNWVTCMCTICAAACNSDGDLACGEGGAGGAATAGAGGN